MVHETEPRGPAEGNDSVAGSSLLTGPQPTRSSVRQAERARRARRFSSAWCTGIMTLVGTVIALGFWPGRMDADTLNEIDEARRGVYTDQHSPVLQALWHPFVGIGLSPAILLLCQILMFIAGTYLILRLVLTRRVATGCACLLALFPPIMGTLGLVGRDTWFTVLTVFGFGLVAAALRRTGRRRTALLILSLVVVWFALAARQNAGPAVVIIAAFSIGLLRHPPAGRSPDRPLRIRTALSALTLAVLFVVLSMASLSGINRLLNVRHFSQLGTLQIYDLAGLSRADGRNYFPATVLKDRTMTTLSLRSNVAS
ncbi:MAG: hypothetical protein JWL73_3546, partial [Actinomycetia bacterium]|nr:hypothetical protein [Actinomycetes bacterium]